MNNAITQLLSTRAGLGLSVVRILVGLIFMAHGAQKLFGLFGGYGLEGTGQWMESIGLAPGYLMALLSGSAEFFGGLALVIGLLARPAALALSVTLVVGFSRCTSATACSCPTMAMSSPWRCWPAPSQC